jgi:hypothetical protein
MVFADDAEALLGGDDAAVGIAQHIVLSGAPAGGNPGQQHARNVADRRVVVTFGVHQPDILRCELRVRSAGVVGGIEQSLPQEWISGLGQAVLVGKSRGVVDIR